MMTMMTAVLLRELLAYMDAELADHLKAIDEQNLLFTHRWVTPCVCHAAAHHGCRWMMLSFKREFKFPDALRMFEIIASHHLELTG